MSGVDAHPDVYGPHGRPTRHGSPPLDGPHGIFTTHPECRLLFNHALPVSPPGADYIWAVSHDLSAFHLPDTELAAIVHTLDRGGMVAIHGRTAMHVQHGIEHLLMLAGGAHA